MLTLGLHMLLGAVKWQQNNYKGRQADTVGAGSLDKHPQAEA